HVGSHDINAVLLHGVIQADVAHLSGDDGVLRELFVFGEVYRANGQNMVAVDDLAAVIGHDHAVTVAVQADADVGAVLGDGFAQALRVQSSGFVIDVEAVGLITQHHQVGA